MSTTPLALIAVIVVAMPMSTWALVDAIDPPCVQANLPTVSNLDPEKLMGVWFLTHATSVSPETSTITGYELDILSYDQADEGNITLDMQTIATFSDQDGCTTVPTTCLLDENNNYCRMNGIVNFFVLVGTDNDNILAVMAPTIIGDLAWPALRIFNRDYRTTPDLSLISDALSQFCGDDSLSLTSGFYPVVIPYRQSTDCFNPPK